MSSTSKTRRGFLAAPEAAERRNEAEIAKSYPRWRASVFWGIFIGYAGFYLIRNNVSLASAIFKDDDIFSAAEIGFIANAVLISYGLSKFFMAMLSDRSNARYFLPLGLALSAITNLFIAFTPVLTASVAIFATVMFVNGWFQGMGWPPSGRVLVHWFSTNERGWKTSVWNCAHNVGGAGVGIAAAFAMEHFAANESDWRPVFWFPALIALVVAAVAFLMIRDRPEVVGLPPIAEYRNDPPKATMSDDALASMSWGRIVVTYVLKNRIIVLLALTNVFVYTLRYGVLNWIPIYLSDNVDGTDIEHGFIGFALFELSGIVGTLLCGWISDKVFKGWRSGAGLLFLAGVGVSLVAYWQLPATAPLWMFYVLIALIGGLIYGPVMLIGLQAIDLAPQNVAGTAAGFTGMFGYLLGATLASTGVGLLIEHFGWDVTFMALIAVVVLGLVFMFVVGRDERRMMAARASAE